MKRSETFIKTNRMWLRQIDETDAETIVDLRSDENVYRFFSNPVKLTLKDHRKWYEEEYILDDYRMDWIAVDDETGVLIGIYGAKIKSEDTVEVSYITCTSKQKMGYASEAIRSILFWSYKHFLVQYAVVNVHEDNLVSINFAKKMGFEFVKKEDMFLTMKRVLDESLLGENM